MEIRRSRIHIKDVPLLAKVNRFFLESSETSEFVRRNKSIEQWPKETWRHRYPLLLLSNHRHFIRSWIRVYSSNYSQTGCDACGLAFFPSSSSSSTSSRPCLPSFLASSFRVRAPTDRRFDANNGRLAFATKVNELRLGSGILGIWPRVT